MKTLRYHAAALNDEGRIGILLVTRAGESGSMRTTHQEWTGETYPDTSRGRRMADELLISRNRTTRIVEE